MLFDFTFASKLKRILIQKFLLTVKFTKTGSERWYWSRTNITVPRTSNHISEG
jgi:hypothetical protein